MGTSRGAAYRRFYLYSALSVAVIAIAVALAVLLHLGLQRAIDAPSLPNEPSRNLSLAVALLAIALPVGAVHLWLILRSFADAAERAAGIRHQYLNLWIAFALFVVLFATQSAIGDWSRDRRADVTWQASAAAVAALVAAIAAVWISRTPPLSVASRVRASVVVMLFSIGAAAFSAGNAASAAGGLFAYPDVVLRQPFPGNFDPRTFEDQTLRASYFVLAAALVIWSFAFAWQRRFQEARDRLAYALAGYGIGTAILLAGAAFGIAGAIEFARDRARVEAFTSPWGSLAAGALLVVVHGTLLLTDRGRNGHPGVTTTRLLLAFPAIVGLATVVGGIGLGWHAVLERDEVGAQVLGDELTQAAVLIAVGVAAYVPSWLAFDRRTTAESAVRRFYLFSVVCLALVAGLVSAVTVLYEGITAAIGVGDAFAGRTALTWLVPALAFALIFVAHLRLLLRDQRSTRIADAAPPADALLALLEEVRTGRVTTEQAAATIRGGVG